MKAIRKEDGKEIDVKFLHPEEYIDSEEDGFGRRIYNRGSLILNEPTDWQSFRREAAKDILCAIVRTESVMDDRNIDHCTKEEQVKDAIRYTDLLIKQLQEEKQ